MTAARPIVALPTSALSPLGLSPYPHTDVTVQHCAQTWHTQLGLVDNNMTITDDNRDLLGQELVAIVDDDSNIFNVYIYIYLCVCAYVCVCQCVCVKVLCIYMILYVIVAIDHPHAHPCLCQLRLSKPFMKLPQGVGVVELSGRHALFPRENLPVIFSLTFDNRLAAWGGSRERAPDFWPNVSS